MGRDRIYGSDADRQRAYRERNAREQARLREQLKAGASKATKRQLVSVKLIKILGMLGSDHAGERDTAARMATQILKEAKLTWYDVLDVAPEEPKKK
jgi:hypothetical protein